MAVIGTNQSKITVTPTNTRKTGQYSWGDIGATWGDALATWGNYGIVPVNQTRNSIGGTIIAAGSPVGLLLSITHPTAFTLGITNQSKS